MVNFAGERASKGPRVLMKLKFDLKSLLFVQNTQTNTLVTSPPASRRTAVEAQWLPREWRSYDTIRSCLSEAFPATAQQCGRVVRACGGDRLYGASWGMPTTRVVNSSHVLSTCTLCKIIMVYSALAYTSPRSLCITCLPLIRPYKLVQNSADNSRQVFRIVLVDALLALNQPPAL